MQHQIIGPNPSKNAMVKFEKNSNFKFICFPFKSQKNNKQTREHT